MALNLTGYQDPGVYIQQVVVPGGVTTATVPNTTTLIGIANRNKRASNEAVTRGLVSNEAITLGVTGGNHFATLIDIGNRQTSQTTVTKDGVLLDSSLFSYPAATVTGLAFGTLNFTSINQISLAFDGLRPVTIAITGSGADLTTITGDLITQRLGSIGSIAAVTPTQVAEGINKALAGATSLGYGSAYGSVATVSLGEVVLTSPLSTPLSDLRLYAGYPTGSSETAAVFGTSLPFQAATKLLVADSAYSGTSVYVASYVSTNSLLDTLVNSNVQSIIKVGSFAGVTSFKLGTDFTLSGNSLSWGASTAATFTGSITATTFDVSTNNTILLSLDGKAAVSILLNGLGSPPPGYANPGTPSAATPAELVNNINAVLANSVTYGPQYRLVASVTGSGPYQLTLTSPNVGVGSSIQLAAPALLSAVTALFGLSSGQLPFAASGVGSKPTPGAIYFATYQYTRPSNDYNVVKRFFTPDSLYQDLGYPTSVNTVAIAAGIAFDNSAPSVLAIQVNDATFPGSPQQSEFLAALNASSATDTPTEICVLSTALPTQIDLMNNIINNSSATQKHPRRGWFGMARNTIIGDRDTPGSYVAMAVRTLQVPGDSPGRGRLILTAPPNVSRDITQEDGSIVTVALDGSFLAVSVAARMTAFTSPSDTLLRKTVNGFRADLFQTYLKAERAQLASSGVNVVTYDPNAGTLLLKDPITTEVGGGGLVSFQEISASTQKDAVTAAVTQSVDSNLVGVVPSDLATFIATIKGLIGGILRSLIASGAIGPFKTSTGVTRDIDYAADIQVFQNATDPTAYSFRYFFNLRYPVKRLYGEYSVDNVSF